VAQKMKKFFFLVLFFLFVPVAHADIRGATTTLYTYDVGTNNTVFGNSATAMGICVRFATSSDVYITDFRLQLYKTGSPTDSLQAFIATSDPEPTPDVTWYASSTNTISGSSLTTSQQPYWFYFSSSTATSSLIRKMFVGRDFAGDGMAVAYPSLCVVRTGAPDVTNYYRIARDATANDKEHPTGFQLTNAMNKGSNITGHIRSTILGQFYIEATEGSCPSGYECYTIEEMASTTEAIYTVGYTMQTYIGIFLLLTFGLLAFGFVRRFL
jgi:hypothetical protein